MEERRVKPPQHRKRGHVYPRTPYQSHQSLLRGLSPIRFPALRRQLWDRTRQGPSLLLAPSSVVPELRFPNALLAHVREATALVQSYGGLQSVMMGKLCARLKYPSGPQAGRDGFHAAFSQRLSTLRSSAGPPKAFTYPTAAAPKPAYSAPDLSLPDTLVVPVFCGLTSDSKNSPRSRVALEDAANLELTDSDYDNLARALRDSCADPESCHPAQFMKCHALCVAHHPLNSIAFRGEIIVPGVSLSFTPIRPLPLVQSPLAEQLRTFEFMAPTQRASGFLTLDQARAALPLLDSDVAAYACPLVGVWLYNTQAMHDVHIWASCLRFLYSDAIQDRVTVAPLTFLVLFFDASRRVHFFMECKAELVGRSPMLQFEFAAELLLDPVTDDSSGSKHVHSHCIKPEPVRQPSRLSRFRQAQSHADAAAALPSHSPGSPEAQHNDDEDEEEAHSDVELFVPLSDDDELHVLGTPRPDDEDDADGDDGQEDDYDSQSDSQTSGETLSSGDEPPRTTTTASSDVKPALTTSVPVDPDQEHWFALAQQQNSVQFRVLSQQIQQMQHLFQLQLDMMKQQPAPQQQPEEVRVEEQDEQDQQDEETHHSDEEHDDEELDEAKEDAEEHNNTQDDASPDGSVAGDTIREKVALDELLESDSSDEEEVVEQEPPESDAEAVSDVEPEQEVDSAPSHVPVENDGADADTGKHSDVLAYDEQDTDWRVHNDASAGVAEARGDDLPRIRFSPLDDLNEADGDEHITSRYLRRHTSALDDGDDELDLLDDDLAAASSDGNASGSTSTPSLHADLHLPQSCLEYLRRHNLLDT